MLDWDIPVDDGGEITQYNITGTPDDISNITEDTMITITNLSPNSEYTFYVSAINSLGLGNPASVQCNTPGNGKNYYSSVNI